MRRKEGGTVAENRGRGLSYVCPRGRAMRRVGGEGVERLEFACSKPHEMTAATSGQAIWRPISSGEPQDVGRQIHTQRRVATMDRDLGAGNVQAAGLGGDRGS